jgi:hypothetical protein
MGEIERKKEEPQPVPPEQPREKDYLDAFRMGAKMFMEQGVSKAPPIDDYKQAQEAGMRLAIEGTSVLPLFISTPYGFMMIDRRLNNSDLNLSDVNKSDAKSDYGINIPYMKLKKAVPFSKLMSNDLKKLLRENDAPANHSKSNSVKKVKD